MFLQVLHTPHQSSKLQQYYVSEYKPRDNFTFSFTFSFLDKISCQHFDIEYNTFHSLSLTAQDSYYTYQAQQLHRFNPSILVEANEISYALK
jgi:hypothetical protein